MHFVKPITAAGFLCFLWVMPPQTSQGEDWPHWMGPSRDNVWNAEGILEKFPTGGPKILWRTKVAGGYSGPAVVGDRLYLTDYVTKDNVKIDNFERKEFTGTERVLCLNATNGREIWKHEYPVKYGISYPAGPRCTPVVDDGLVYTLGAEGNLICFDAAKGSIVWSKELKQVYGTKSALWGYASHPLVDGQKLICLAGGNGSHTVALNKKTGAELWRYGTATEQGYSPPTIIQAAGKRQLILMSPNWIASVDPDSGKEFWTQPYEANNGSIIMTPVLMGDYLFVGGFNRRNLLLQLAKDKPAAQVVWRDKNKFGISPVNVQPFVQGNVLYGMDGDGTTMAVEFPEGKRLWETGAPLGERPMQTGTAFLVKQGNRFFLFAETGDLIIGTLSREGFRELDRAPLLKPTGDAFGRSVVWSAPAFASKRVFLRNDEECICVDLAK